MDIFLLDAIVEGDAAHMQMQLDSVPSGEDINLLINSPGGSVVEGMAMATLIKKHPAKVKAQVIGVAASMSTIVALAADSVSMIDGGIWMIHHPVVPMGGNAKALRQSADLAEAISKPMINIYAKKTGLHKRAVSKLMDEQELMPASKAKKLRFIDSIEQPLAMVAELDLTNYKDMNIEDLKAKVNDFAKAFGWIETSEDEKPLLEAKKEEEAQKVTDEVTEKVKKAETAEEAISAELVTQQEFAPKMNQVLDALHTITEFISTQPTEKEASEALKEAAQDAVTDLLKEMKSKVSVPGRTGSPVVAEATPFKSPTDADKRKGLQEHIEEKRNKKHLKINV